MASCGMWPVHEAQEVFRLPRAKPIPKEKPKTRWDKFMEAFGLMQEAETSSDVSRKGT